MITWTCHICGEERPNDKISVLSTDLSAEYGFPPGTVQQNVRHCNDDVRCCDRARAKRFFKNPEAEEHLLQPPATVPDSVWIKFGTKNGRAALAGIWDFEPWAKDQESALGIAYKYTREKQ